MQQINNGFDTCYFLTREGKVYNKTTGNYLTLNNYSYSLKTTEGKYKKITLRKLYKLVFNENYVIDNIENLEGEEWKPVERTEEKYWISNKGRCKSYKGLEAIILRPNYLNGYQRVDIIQDGSRASKLIHRLVGAAFLMQPKYSDMILHHKNGIRDENSVENLEWLTPAEHKKVHKEMKELEKGEHNGEASKNCSEPKNNKCK